MFNYIHEILAYKTHAFLPSPPSLKVYIKNGDSFIAFQRYIFQFAEWGLSGHLSFLPAHFSHSEFYLRPPCTHLSNSLPSNFNTCRTSPLLFLPFVFFLLPSILSVLSPSYPTLSPFWFSPFVLLNNAWIMNKILLQQSFVNKC